ncbi:MULTISPECIES: Trp biosynthesis-associated membrane protein [Thermomonosporaceae]|uniref:Trp biosynthesis-associated membrane protein n=1 Tax=Thermomonosporaceae TaxID=2012 RepID=UPI00255AA83D|nr:MULTISPECIES: Trp biosynthesis-associated membrane protein [Thermomonosporaceae]MDL4770962.1 Trp biosynthesis-associated membrane protein [Actinomadura xylanilytica]
MSPGRERGLTALICAAGAGLALLAAGRPWASVKAREAITPFVQDLTGRDLGGAAGALGWAGLAGLAALFATRGRVRAGVGVLLALFGAGVVYSSAIAVRHAHVVSVAGEKSALLRLGSRPAADVNLWWTVSVAGGVLLMIAGLIALVRGTRWPGMSARYEREAPAASHDGGPGGPGGAGGGSSADVPDDPSSLWKSLDRGEDPTAARESRR